MLNWIKKLFTINLTINNVHPVGRYEFDVINDVLIVHVPVGLMPQSKAQEHVESLAKSVNTLKEQFKVKNIVYVPKTGR